MVKISLIHPSRGRPEQARTTHENWMSKASGDVEIEHILSLDFSDPKNEMYGMVNDKFIGFGGKHTIDHNTCVVEATNNAAQLATGDIFVYLSDDFDCPQHWDAEIVKRLPNLTAPSLLKVDDCLQRFHVDVLTIPIMTRPLYTRLGYFFHPEYKSMFVDQDLFWVCSLNGWIVLAPELPFPHNHYSIGKAKKDETYTRSDANWGQGKALYARRRAEGFVI